MFLFLLGSIVFDVGGGTRTALNDASEVGRWRRAEPSLAQHHSAAARTDSGPDVHNDTGEVLRTP